MIIPERGRNSVSISNTIRQAKCRFHNHRWMTQTSKYTQRHQWHQILRAHLTSPIRETWSQQTPHPSRVSTFKLKNRVDETWYYRHNSIHEHQRWKTKIQLITNKYKRFWHKICNHCLIVLHSQTQSRSNPTRTQVFSDLIKERRIRTCRMWQRCPFRVIMSQDMCSQGTSGGQTRKHRRSAFMAKLMKLGEPRRRANLNGNNDNVNKLKRWWISINWWRMSRMIRKVLREGRFKCEMHNKIKAVLHIEMTQNLVRSKPLLSTQRQVSSAIWSKATWFSKKQRPELLHQITSPIFSHLVRWPMSILNRYQIHLSGSIR